MNSSTKKIARLKSKYSKLSLDRGSAGFKTLILIILPPKLSASLLKRFLGQSEYRSKRESIKYFLLSNRAYGARKSRKCNRLLRISISLLGLNFPNHFAALLHSAISSTLKDSKSRRSMSDSVLIATKELEPAIFDATGWYQLSRGLFCLGYFRAAWVSREKSLDLSIVEGTKSTSSATAVRRAVEAYLERLDFNSVRYILLRGNVLDSKDLESIRETLRWFEGNFGKNPVINGDENEKNLGPNNLLRALINKKKVALVGPGQPRGEYGFEIDASEIVARIKYPGSRYLLDQALLGKRCDISQYPNLAPLRELARISPNEYFDDLRLIISGETNSSNVGSTPVFSENQELPLYRTTATTGLRLLISLIRQGPASLKIFGYDFYVEAEPYNMGMRSFYMDSAWKFGEGHFLFGKNIEYPKDQITSSFGSHDPVSNFCFARNLYRASLFEIEPYGKSILELTPYQYVEKLEEMLGDW